MVRGHRWLGVFIAIAVIPLLACWIPSLPGGGFGTNTIRGSGRVGEEERTVDGVRGVELATIGTLHIEIGERESLRIEADANLLPYFESEVRGETLTIKVEGGTNLRTTRPAHYYLTVVDLDSITLSSSGNVEAADLEAKLFTVRVSSSGNLQMGWQDRATGDPDQQLGQLHSPQPGEPRGRRAAEQQWLGHDLGARTADGSPQQQRGPPLCRGPKGRRDGQFLRERDQHRRLETCARAAVSRRP
jgi:hypothetical protein